MTVPRYQPPPLLAGVLLSVLPSYRRDIARAIRIEELEAKIRLVAASPEHAAWIIDLCRTEQDLAAAFESLILGEIWRRPDCTAHGYPPSYFYLGDPDSPQHCFDCHCTCDPDGPRCGHYAGCPGC